MKFWDDTKRKVHEKCEKKLIYVKPPVCLRCGKPVYSPLQEYCMDCSRSDAPIDGGTAVWVYTKEMAQSIAKYKYEGKKEYAGFYVGSGSTTMWGVDLPAKAGLHYSGSIESTETADERF